MRTESGVAFRGSGLGHRALRVLTLCLIGLLALVFIDVASSVVYRTNEAPVVTVIPASAGTNDRVVVLFPGYAMSGRIAASSLFEAMGADAVIMGVTYAERGMDIDQISSAVFKKLEAIQPRHVYFYGASLGGLVASRVAERYAISHPHESFSVILDTAPSGPNDIHRPSLLMAASCWYPGGVLSSALWSLFARTAPHIPPSGADKGIIQQGRAYGQSVGTPALTSQACFIYHSKTPPFNAPLDLYYAAAPDAATSDPLVNTSSAQASWKRTSATMARIAITGRKGEWHVPLIERPTDVASVLARVFSERNGRP